MTVAVASGPLAVAAAAAPSLIGTAWMGMQTRRANKWWHCILRADDAGELQAKIETGLLNESEHVIAGVVEGARAASAAVDMAAVPIIAELSRRFIAAEDIPRWFYRGSLELFERLTAEEILTSRTLLNDVEAIVSDRLSIVAEGVTNSRAIPFSENRMGSPVPISAITDPERIFSMIKRAGLGFESSGYGIAGAATALELTRTVNGWLRAALIG